MKRTTLLAATFALLASSAFAQEVGKSEEIVTPNTPTESVTTTEPAAAKTEPTSTYPVVKCALVQLRVEALQDPAKFYVSVFDQALGNTPEQVDKDAFLKDMQDCNGDIVQARPSQYASAGIHVVSDLQGWATIKVPDARKAKMVATFHSSLPLPELKDKAFWVSDQFGDLTQIDLKVTAEPGKVVEKVDQKG